MCVCVCVCVCMYACVSTVMCLQNQEFRLATKALSAERSRWISEGLVVIRWYVLLDNYRSVDRLIRASRHYERAAQMLTRQTVATARKVCNAQLEQCVYLCFLELFVV